MLAIDYANLKLAARDNAVNEIKAYTDYEIDFTETAIKANEWHNVIFGKYCTFYIGEGHVLASLNGFTIY